VKTSLLRVLGVRQTQPRSR